MSTSSLTRAASSCCASSVVRACSRRSSRRKLSIAPPRRAGPCITASSLAYSARSSSSAAPRSAQVDRACGAQDGACAQRECTARSRTELPGEPACGRPGQRAVAPRRRRLSTSGSRLASGLRHAKVNQAHLVGVAEARLGRQPLEQLVVQRRRLGAARRHRPQPRWRDLLCHHGIPLTLGVDCAWRPGTSTDRRTDPPWRPDGGRVHGGQRARRARRLLLPWRRLGSREVHECLAAWRPWRVAREDLSGVERVRHGGHGLGQSASLTELTPRRPRRERRRAIFVRGVTYLLGGLTNDGT